MINNLYDMPITRYIHQEFERTMSAVINASDLGWEAGAWPNHFFVSGWERAFNFWSDLRRHGELQAKVYRDSMGYEVIVNND